MTAATYADRIRGITTSEAIKAPVDVATTANITLSGAQTIDGVAVTTGDRVLVRSQTTTTENGIYDVATTAWTRALDFNGTGDAIEGTLVWVRSGDTYADRFFQLTTTDDPIVFGTSAITFGNGIPTTNQLQDGTINWVDGGGTADAITATYSPAVTALVDGQLCYVRATATNATTTPTFSPNGLTAHTIIKNGGVALAAGDIVGDGHELILRYDLANTRWELLNPASKGGDVVGPTSATSGNIATFNGTTGKLIADGAIPASTLLVDGDIGSAVQAYGATLTSLEGLTLAAGDVIYATAADTLTNLAKGTAAQVLTMNAGATAPEWATVASSGLTAASNLTPTGTSADFTGLPSGTNQLILTLNGISTDNTGHLYVRIGDSGGLENTGYNAGNFRFVGLTVNDSSFDATGFKIFSNATTATFYGSLYLTRHGATNTWSCQGLLTDTIGGSVNYLNIVTGGKTLSAELDRISLVAATGNFDAGTVGLSYQ